MNEQAFYKLNPNFLPLSVPPLRKSDGRIFATPEENFVDTYLRKPTDKKTPKFLREIYWLLQNPQNYNRVLCVAPRGFAKSTVVCVNDTLFDIFVRSNKELCEKLGCPEQYRYHSEILLITASKPLATKWISKLKWHITSNDRITSKFGNISTDGEREGIWQQDHIKVHSASGDIEVIAMGRGSAIRGWRPSKVKVDDILKDDEATSDTSSDKIEYWLKSTIEGLFDELDATLFWIATILAPEDVVDNAYEKRDWSDDWFRVKYHAYGDDGNSIWPDKFPNKFLKFKERNMGRAFAAEYMNEPIAGFDPVFLRPWMQRRYRESEKPPSFHTVLSIDPAARDQEKNDYTAFTVWGFCFDGKNKMNVYMLDVHEDHLDGDSIAKKALDLYRRWNCDDMVLEIQVAQIFLRDLIIREARDQTMFVNIVEVEHPPTKNRKKMHAKSVDFYFKQDKVLFLDGDDNQGKLINQLCNFPAAKHDDMVDSTVMALRHMKDHYLSLEDEDFEDNDYEENEQVAWNALGV